MKIIACLSALKSSESERFIVLFKILLRILAFTRLQDFAKYILTVE